MHNTYHTMRRHLDHHMFKRGANKGSAPAFRRGADHHLVIDMGHAMVYRMYRTHIITAYPDGRVVLDFGGYAHRTTTRRHFRDAAALFMKTNGSIYSDNQNGYVNTVLSMPGVRTALTGQTLRLAPTESDTWTLHPEDVRSKIAYRADRAANKRVLEMFEPIKAVMPLLWSAEPVGAYYNAASAIASSCKLDMLCVDPADYPAFVDTVRSHMSFWRNGRFHTSEDWRAGWKWVTAHISLCNRVKVEVPC